jgi:CDP-diacylglycerol--glycerol-3-phosphate 3-phosphatidyltransferase
VFLTFVIVACLLASGWPAKLWALAAFLLASATDWLDGYLARRLNQTSALGALLDPIADKILVLGLFSVFVMLHLMPWWMLAVIAGREVLVTAIRLALARRRITLVAAAEGKQKMVSQVVAILGVLVLLAVQAWGESHAVSPALIRGLGVVVEVSLWVAMGLTIISGCLFFIRHQAVLKRAVHSPH